MVLFLTAGLHIHGDEVLSLSWLWVAWVFCRQKLEVEEAVDTEKRSSLSIQYVGGTTVAAHCSSPLGAGGSEHDSGFCAPSTQCPRTSSILECKRCSVFAACHKTLERRQCYHKCVCCYEPHMY